LAFRLRPGLLLCAQAASTSALCYGILTLQVDAAVRRNELIFAAGTTFVCFLLGRASFESLIRDVKNRLVIERQQRELESLNASLEDRVQTQVKEIVERSRKIDQLNAELREQVKERSRELSKALAGLVSQHGEGGAIKPGDRLAGRFEIEKFVGRGGMGTVFAALDQLTKERVAVKVIEASSARELDAIHRFLREAHASARVEHPAVVYARHVDLDNNLLFMVFAFIEGESLQSYLRSGKSISPLDVARLGAFIADALAVAHAAGVVHRDIKPGNIMVDEGLSSIHLLDFGISKLRDVALSDSSQTREGAILGTPAYMAPEQASGASNATTKSDIYSLAVVLYEMLAGHPPFDGSNLRAIMVAHVLREPPPLRALRPGTPEPLAALIHRCLAKAPEQRPSAGELASALRAMTPDLADAPAVLAAGPPPDASTIADSPTNSPTN
jgi:serine/threonine protein kinase